MGKTATIIGATGLIGSHLLERLLEDGDFTTVRILTRRLLDINHPKLEKKLVDFNDADSLLIALSGSDVVFCSVGTTQKKVKGDREAYRKVDHDIPVRIARFGKETGCEKFILVSSVGANSKSRNFYLRLKGEVEEEIKKLGIRTVHIMRPSMLLGERKEFRGGERIGQTLMKTFSFLLPPKYKPISAVDVARAMQAAAKKETQGWMVHEFVGMKELLKG